MKLCSWRRVRNTLLSCEAACFVVGMVQIMRLPVCLCRKQQAQNLLICHDLMHAQSWLLRLFTTRKYVLPNAAGTPMHAAAHITLCPIMP